MAPHPVRVLTSLSVNTERGIGKKLFEVPVVTGGALGRLSTRHTGDFLMYGANLNKQF